MTGTEDLRPAAVIMELIHRRRRQLIIHSIIYYRLGTSIITDAQWDGWARELVRLQSDHPQLSARVEYLQEEFIGFDGSTGFDLPLGDPRSVECARKLLTAKASNRS